VVKGSLVWVSLDPARGAEVPKTRPCIVVSRTEANDIASTVTIVPLSSLKGRATDRLVQPLLSTKETHLSKDSRALCDQVRTIDKRRIPRNSRRVGARANGKNRSWPNIASGAGRVCRDLVDELGNFP
jgi:mRNA interferase MazF